MSKKITLREQEDFWDLPCISEGLEVPWMQALLPLVPLGFPSRIRELRASAGHIASEVRKWTGFRREFNEHGHAHSREEERILLSPAPWAG